MKAAPISEVIRSVFSRMEGDKTLPKEEVESWWLELAGEDAFKHSRPVGLKKKVFVVRVDSSSWLEELVMRKRRLLKGLKQRMGRDRISEIHFKIGEF